MRKDTPEEGVLQLFQLKGILSSPIGRDVPLFFHSTVLEAGDAAQYRHIRHSTPQEAGDAPALHITHHQRSRIMICRICQRAKPACPSDGPHLPLRIKKSRKSAQFFTNRLQTKYERLTRCKAHAMVDFRFRVTCPNAILTERKSIAIRAHHAAVVMLFFVPSPNF